MLIIKQNKLIFKDWQKGKWVEKSVPPKHLLGFLLDVVHLENVKLKDLLNIIEKSDLAPVLGMLYGCDVTRVLAESKTKPAKDKEPLDWLEFQEYGDILNKWFTHKFGLSGKKKNDKQNWGIGLTLVAQLMDTPLKIKETWEFMIFKDGYSLKNAKKYKFENSGFRLFDLLHELFEELCFYGYDEHKKATSEGLHQQIEDIKTGKAKTVPWSEVKKKLNKKRKK